MMPSRMPHDFQRACLSVVCDGGETIVDGYAHGFFHLRFDDFQDPPCFVVSHCPTGLRLPGYVTDPEQAIALTRAVALSRRDWRAVDYGDLAAIQATVIPIMRAYGCESILDQTSEADRRAAFDGAVRR